MAVYRQVDIHSLMKASKCDPNQVTIEATVITGFEFQAMDECNEKCKPLSICKAKGRIYFNILKENFQKVYSLKSVDNLFLVGESIKNVPFNKNKEGDLELIKSLVNEVDWKTFITTWSQLVHFEGILFPEKKVEAPKPESDTSENASQENSQKGAGDSSLDEKKETSASLTDSSLKDLPIMSENEINTLMNGLLDSNLGDVNLTVGLALESNLLQGQGDFLDVLGLSDVNQTIEKLLNPRVDESTSSVDRTTDQVASLCLKDDSTDFTNNSSEAQVCDNQSKDCDDTQNVTKEQTSSKGDEESPKTDDKNPEETKKPRDAKGGNRDHKKNNRYGRNRYGRKGPEKKKRTGPGPKPFVDDGILKYRVTCYRAGTHSFSSMEAAAEFGGRLNDEFHWTVDLTRFDLNVVLVIEQNSGYITSALTKESFHRRNISHFGRTTMRATMCYHLIRLAQPLPGEIVLDPLCGGGSIPIEGSISFPYTFQVCGDKDEKAMTRTIGNVLHVTKERGLPIDAFKWDALNIPLKDQSIDVFVTDLPFGKRSGDKKDNYALYEKLLHKMARVVKLGTGRAALLSYDKKALIQAIWSCSYWKQMRTFSVNQGGLNSSVFLLLRTSEKIE